MKKIADINDTIVAISTPIGEAGIGIVRLSGSESLKIADRIFLPGRQNGKRKIKIPRLKSHTIHYGWIVEPAKPKAHQKRRDGQIIDEVLLTVMRAPKTYTREDIIEINCHSGIVPLKKILNLILCYGARLAGPGEFTRRAFLNGRIDLSQAESVLEIVRTKSETYLNACLNRLRGGFSQQITKLSEELFNIISQFEAQIDFPQEDTVRGGAHFLNQIEKIKDELSTCLKSTQEAKIVRDGLRIAICGRTNVGKSSLLNALINEDRALVTPFAGTTRDAIEEQVCFDGIPLAFIDTAGLRTAHQPVEREAAKRSEKIIENAQLLLLLFDASCPATKADYRFINKFKRQKNVLAVLNKIDLPLKFDQGFLRKSFASSVKISALYRIGLDRLKNKIIKKIWQGKLASAEPELIANARQEQLLGDSVQLLESAASSLRRGISLEIIVEDLKAALALLNKLCGRFGDYEGELLDAIFSQFCIGK